LGGVAYNTGLKIHIFSMSFEDHPKTVGVAYKTKKLNKKHIEFFSQKSSAVTIISNEPTFPKENILFQIYASIPSGACK
jgi:hypothetical protein